MAQFEAESQEPNVVQLELETTKTHQKGLIALRDQAEAIVQKKLVNLANAVRCDPNHGSDGAFYRSLGFVVDSERKRPTRTVIVTTPPAANVA